MRKCIFMAGCVLWTVVSIAQVQVVQLPGNPLRFTLSDWQRFTVTSTVEHTEEVVVLGEIRDGGSSKVLARFRSTKMLLSPGLNAYSEANLNLDQLLFPESSLGATLRAGKSLPAGSYVACIMVQSSARQVLNTSCQEVSVAPISGPVLIYPAQRARIIEKQPVFTWMPAIMEGSASEMSYELQVFEMRDGQQMSEAASRNRAIFKKQVRGSTLLAYPSTAKELELTKQYLWRVQAFYKGFALGSSEYHSFRIAENRNAVVPTDTVLIQMDPHRIQPVTNCSDVVRLSFKHYVPNEHLQIVLQEHTGEKHHLSAEQYELDMSSGQLWINLGQLPFIEEGAVYRLECKRQNNQKMIANLQYGIK